VVVDRRQVGLGQSGDVAQRGAGDAVLCEELLGGVEEAVFGGFGHGTSRGLAAHPVPAVGLASTV
jgi:hypothetical protein